MTSSDNLQSHSNTSALSSSKSTSPSASASASAATSPSISHWSSRPSLYEIFECSASQFHDLIVNHPEWVDVSSIYPSHRHSFDRWSGHHFLSYLVQEGDIERIQILKQFSSSSIQQFDVNQINHHGLTPLTIAGSIAHSVRHAKLSQEQKDALSMRLISLLASMGADPNVVMPLDYDPTALDYILHSCSHSVLRHYIFTFHPINCGITCNIPLDLHHTHRVKTKEGFQHLTIFQRFHWFPTNQTSLQQFTNIINNINQQLITPHLTNMHTFSMATHSRVGRLSAVYRVLRSSQMYDPHLLRLIWRFLYISCTLPTTQEQVEEMERARREKQQAPEQAT